jgi:hypothetical protein
LSDDAAARDSKAITKARRVRAFLRQFEPDTGHSMDAGLVRREDGAMVQSDSREIVKYEPG